MDFTKIFFPENCTETGNCHSVILLIAFLVLYILAWYLPNKEAYDYMMAHQSGEFRLSAKIWEYIRFNIDYHFLKGWVQWFVYIFLFLLVTGFVLLKRTKSKRYPVLFFSSLVWFILELT